MSRQPTRTSSVFALKRYEPVAPNPVPLESDEDPDFNNGALVIPSPKRKRGQPKKQKTSRVSRKRANKVPDDFGDYNPERKAVKKTISHNHNPLLEFFGYLGLQSASEGEAKSEKEDPEEQFEEEPEEDLASSEEEDQGEVPQYSLPRTLAIIAKSQTQSNVEDDGSVTEPESDPEPEIENVAKSQVMTTQSTLKRKSPSPTSSILPPAKKAKILDPDPDSSVTEPESDVQDSVTEPESDDEYSQVGFEPRPSFVCGADQKPLGPLVLDDGKSSGRFKVQVPGSINTFLRDYQRDGVTFFWERFRDGKGGLLGDDMGKTIQVISFLSAIMRKNGDKRDVDRRRDHVSALQNSVEWRKHRTLPPANETWPTCLIIAPSSVVPNWEREFQTWGYFEVSSYTTAASAEERANILRDFKFGRLDVVLTTFELARRDIALIDDLPWSCVIVDEAHRVKNERSKLTVALNQFACDCRFGLTGTAIQNSYSELWTILNWTNPGCVGTKKQWEGYVARPLTRGQSKSASEDERVQAALVAKILKDKLLPLYFLRRTKEIIIHQLPKKTDEVVFCPLTHDQITVYRRILGTEAVQNMIRKDELCDCGSKEKRRKCCHPFEQGDLFRYMSTLIKVSNHLALVLPSPNDTPEQAARNKQLCKEIFPGGNIPKYGPAMLLPRFCGKWQILEMLLKEWRKDPTSKVLIFTKSVKLLEMLEFHLSSQSLGFVKLDGSTKQADRMPMIDRFHADPDVFVFLISTLAGGTGLNLTGANKVVIFDPNWNPAHDLQAMDRAYRYGQTRDVSVYRLLGAGSLEELIYARQVYKQQQMAVGYDASLQTRYFEGVQGDKGRQGELFGIQNIFKLHEDTLATKMAIEKANLTDLDWALAYMDAKGAAPGKKEKAQWVYEAEAKGKKDHGDLRGLGALLFDDEAAPVVDQDDEISKTLKHIGVNYTHRNESLIAENVVEKERIKVLLAEKRKAGRKSKANNDSGKEKSPAPQWPPRRKHHKPPPGPAEKLMSRSRALVELGMMASADDIHAFAQDFIRKTTDEQNDILAKLDRHARKSGW